MKFTDHELEIQRLSNRIHELEVMLKERNEECDFLGILEAAGVNNWEGYERAQDIFLGEL